MLEMNKAWKRNSIHQMFGLIEWWFSLGCVLWSGSGLEYVQGRCSALALMHMCSVNVWDVGLFMWNESLYSEKDAFVCSCVLRYCSFCFFGTLVLGALWRVSALETDCVNAVGLLPFLIDREVSSAPTLQSTVANNFTLQNLQCLSFNCNHSQSWNLIWSVNSSLKFQLQPFTVQMKS